MEMNIFMSQEKNIITYNDHLFQDQIFNAAYSRYLSYSQTVEISSR